MSVFVKNMRHCVGYRLTNPMNLDFQPIRYISENFRPLENNSVTVWIALDDADEETGVVAQP